MNRILYVDDETALLEIGKLFLERTGLFSVDTVDSAPEALKVMAEKRYDAVISDYQMPGMNGIELLKRVRASGYTLPFIIFTGRGREEIVIQALNEGADFYLQKGGEPVSQFAELAHTVQKAIDQKQAERSIRDHERREADIINFLPDATFAIDSSGHVITWNHAIEEMTGVSAPEMLGKGDYEYAIPFYGQRRPILVDLISESDEVIDKNYSHIIHEKDVLIAETTLPHPKGKPVILMGKASPLYNRRGEILGAIESIRDITKIIEAEESLRESEGQFSAFMDHLPVTAFIKDIHSTNIFVNRRMEEIFGPREWIGKSAREQFPEEAAEKMIEDDQQTLREGYRKTIENLTTKNGDLRNFETYKFRIDRGNKLPLIGGFAVDITERRQAEKALHESEEKYRLVVENSHDAISIFRDDRLLFVNRRALDLTGYSKDELLKMNLWDIIQPDDRTRLQESTSRRLAGDKVPAVLSARILTKSGEVREGDFFADRVIYLGQPAVLGIFRDVTEQKRADRAIRESEQKYRTVFETTGTATVLIEDDATITLANSEFEQLSGFLKEEIENKKKWTEFVVRDDREKMLAQHLLRRQDPQSALPHYEFRFVTRSGDVRDIFLTIDIIPDTKKSVASLLDITERKKAEAEVQAAYEQLTATEGELRRQFRELAENEQKLRQGEERYRDVVEVQTELISRFLPGGKHVFVNEAYCRYFGLPRDEIIGCIFIPHIPGEDREIVNLHFASLTPSHPLGSIEHRIIMPDGEIRWQRWNDRAIFDENGVVTEFQSVGRDVTDRRNAEYALRKSEEQYRSLVETTGTGYVILDKDGRVITANQEYIRLTGRSALAEIKGSVVTDWTAPYDIERNAIEVAQCFRDGQVRGLEIDYQKPDGTIQPIEINASVIRSDSEKIILTLCRDISSRRQAEDELRRADRKLELLSSITRHDISNQITLLTGFLRILEKEQTDPALSQYFQKISKTAERISAMIRFTREYEKIGVKAPRWQEIRTLIGTAASEAMPVTIVVKNDVPAGAEVFADPLIARVFYTLIENALRHCKKISEIRFIVQESGENFLIVYEDDGEGIPAKEKERIFEHGFGKNTGIGLFLAREILSITGITIRETGTPGKGARFEITVPKGAYRVSCGT